MKKVWMILLPVGVGLMLLGGIVYFFCVTAGATGWQTRWGDWRVAITPYGMNVGPMTLFGTGNGNYSDDEYQTGVIPSDTGRYESNKVMLTGSLADFSGLDLDISLAKTTVTQDGSEGYIEWKDFPEGKLKYEVRGDTLTILEMYSNHRNFGWWGNNRNPTLIINLPAGMELSNVTADCGVGDVTIKDLVVKDETTVNGGVGETTLKNLKLGSLDVSGGVGSLDANGLYCTGEVTASGGVGDLSLKGEFYDDVELDSGTGSIYLEGILKADLNANGGLGDIDILLDGDPDDYWYDISGGMGSTRINDKKVKDDYKSSQGDALYKMELSGGMGGIDVTIE